MNQEQLNVLNRDVENIVQQYAGGLVTIIEMCDFFMHTRIRIGSDTELAGLLCPITGLRFPTKEETDAFMATMGNGTAIE